MKLRNYQDRISTQASDNLRQFGCSYLAMECRTGKTLTALATAKKFGATRVLFVTKKKAIGSVMNDYTLLSAEGNPFDMEAINYESVHKATIVPDLVILDEAHCLGAFPRPNKSTQKIKEIAEGLPVLYLSGTPSPESYSQLFHQFWVCSYSPFRDYRNFYWWAKDFVEVQKKYVNGFNLNDYTNAKKELIDEATRHLFITYTQAEAGFSAEIDEIDLVCPIDNKIPPLMRQLRKQKVVKLEGERVILGDTPAKLMSKLHQLSGGTVITETGEHLILDQTRAFYIRDSFRGKKLAVFYCFQSEFDLLTKVFTDWTDNPEEFQASSSKTFICQIRRGREGIRLDTADAIVFYSTEFSYLSYEQGMNRILSKERTEPAKVYFAVSEDGIEKDILEAVRNKKDFTASYYLRKHRRD